MGHVAKCGDLSVFSGIHLPASVFAQKIRALHPAQNEPLELGGIS